MNIEKLLAILISIPIVIFFIWGWQPFLMPLAVIIATIVIIYICYNLFNKNVDTPEQSRKIAEIYEDCKKQENEIIEKHNNILLELDNIYGVCSKKIEFDWKSIYYPGGGTFYNFVRVYTDSSVIVSEWGKIVINFSDILKITVYDACEPNAGPDSASTIVKGKNVLGRAAAGYVIGGGVGAIVGGATAQQETTFNYSSNKHDYTILINTKDLKSPLVKIHTGEDLQATQEIEALITAIIERNKNI